MVKTVLKSIFPIPFLKDVFLRYNRLKIKSVDKLIYREYEPEKRQILTSRWEKPFQLIEVEMDHFSMHVYNEFEKWGDFEQDEFIVHIEKEVYIDPIIGWGIIKPNYLIYPSLGFSRVDHLPKPNLSLLRKCKIRYFEKVISLRDTGELNYFHFYNDVLPKLFLLRDHKISIDDRHIVVSDDLSKREYFKYFVKVLGLEKLRWVFQMSDEVIKTDNVIFCKPLTHTKKYLDEFRMRSLQQKEGGKKNRRIYLTRRKDRLRFIENEEQVIEVLKNYDFEIVDTDDMSIENQISLFRSARYLVAIHGAGMFNMIFSDQPLSILSIFAPGKYLQFHYILLANQYGFYFDAIQGNKGAAYSGGFQVAPNELEERVKLLMLQ